MVRLAVALVGMSAVAGGLLLSAGLVVAPLERPWDPRGLPIATREPLAFHQDCPPVATEPVVIGFCELMSRRGCYDGRRVTVRAEFSLYRTNSGSLKDGRCQSEIVEVEEPPGRPFFREAGEYAFVRVPEVVDHPEWLLWRPVPAPDPAALVKDRYRGWPLGPVTATFTGRFRHRESRLIAFRDHPGAKVHAHLFEDLTFDALAVESAQEPEPIGSSPHPAPNKAGLPRSAR